jgi:flagellar basal-body rod modification protein FlgD
VTNSTGSQVYATAINGSAGSNSWTWNGENSAGTQMPDGVYTVSVVAGNGSGSYSPLSTTVTGVATGVTQSGTTVQLDIGSLPVNFSSITSVASGS